MAMRDSDRGEEREREKKMLEGWCYSREREDKVSLRLSFRE